MRPSQGSASGKKLRQGTQKVIVPGRTISASRARPPGSSFAPTDARMMDWRARRRLVAALLALSLSGCSSLRGGKLWAPETFGLVPIAPNLYIEAGADETTREQLQDAMRQAEQAMHTVFGDVLSRRWYTPA